MDKEYDGARLLIALKIVTDAGKAISNATNRKHAVTSMISPTSCGVKNGLIIGFFSFLYVLSYVSNEYKCYTTNLFVVCSVKLCEKGCGVVMTQINPHVMYLQNTDVMYL